MAKANATVAKTTVAKATEAKPDRRMTKLEATVCKGGATVTPTGGMTFPMGR